MIVKCENCGAPMKPMAQGKYLACIYCSTFSFPTPPEKSIDRLSIFGQKAGLTCPVCNIELLAASMENRRALFCDNCRGTLVSCGDFVEIVRLRRESYTGEPEGPIPLDKQELERNIFCPECKTLMDVHPYYGPGNVVIDSCAQCCLIWLDHGEIAAIERAAGPR